MPVLWENPNERTTLLSLAVLGRPYALLAVGWVAGRSIPMTLLQVLMGLGMVILSGVIGLLLGRRW